jgi:cell division transport system permease protein
MIRQTLYVCSEAFRGLWQAKLMTALSIVTIAVTLLLLGGVGVGILAIRQWLAGLAGQVEMVAYLTDATAADSTQRITLQTLVQEMPEAAAVHFVSKEEAMEKFIQMYGTQMLQSLEGNPLPASLELSLSPEARQTDGANRLRSAIELLPGVDGVTYSREWLERLQTLQRWFVGGALIVGLGLMVAIHFLIANSVRLTIFARRSLIENMYFVGATRLYITMPFVLEGMLQGLIGAALAVLGLFAVQLVLGGVIPRFNLGAAALILLMLGTLFGFIGSRSAVARCELR